jgi:5-methylcytosine-specific restriction endonuclease McrA
MGKTTKERGLGGDHQATRRRLLPLAYGKVCVYCGDVMLRGQPLDLDHVVPRMFGGAGGPTRMVHSRCNRRMGAILGNRVRWGPAKAREGTVRSRW